MSRAERKVLAPEPPLGTWEEVALRLAFGIRWSQACSGPTPGGGPCNACVASVAIRNESRFLVAQRESRGWPVLQSLADDCELKAPCIDGAAVRREEQRS